MKTSRRDNWIVKVSKGTVIVYGEGREKTVTQALCKLLGLKRTNKQCAGRRDAGCSSGEGPDVSHQYGPGSIPAWCHVG